MQSKTIHSNHTIRTLSCFLTILRVGITKLDHVATKLDHVALIKVK